MALVKFLIYPASKQTRCKRENRMTRVYLQDGTELTQLIRIEAIGCEEVVRITHRPIEEGGPISERRRSPRELILTFAEPTIEMVAKRPRKSKL